MSAVKGPENSNIIARWPRPILWQIPSCNEHSSPSHLTHLKAPHRRMRVVFHSGNLTAFPATNRVLHAVKGPEEGNESHGDLTRYSGKSPVTRFIALLRPFDHTQCLVCGRKGGQVTGNTTLILRCGAFR